MNLPVAGADSWFVQRVATVSPRRPVMIVGFLMPDALRTSRLVRERFLHRFRVSINHCQVGAHRAFWTPAPLLPFLERARAVLAAFEPQRGDLPQPRPLAWVERPMHFN